LCPFSLLFCHRLVKRSFFLSKSAFLGHFLCYRLFPSCFGVTWFFFSLDFFFFFVTGSFLTLIVSILFWSYVALHSLVIGFPGMYMYFFFNLETLFIGFPGMYTSVYTYMYVHMYTHTHTNTHGYYTCCTTHTHIHTHTHTHTHTVAVLIRLLHLFYDSHRRELQHKWTYQWAYHYHHWNPFCRFFFFI